ncbi:MAG: magnesium transporter [Gammaproteobacteria bacterium]|nr:magnesium transporter [Gammaproteobacteria bacterium]
MNLFDDDNQQDHENEVVDINEVQESFQAEEYDQNDSQFTAIYEVLDKLKKKGNKKKIAKLIKALHPADIAFLIESIPLEEHRYLVWKKAPLSIRGEILFELNDSIRAQFVKKMSVSELVYATASMDYDELADILEDIPVVVSHVLLESMETQHRKRLESVLSFPEDSAGGLMNTDVVSIRPDITLATVHEYLREIKTLPDTTDKLFVVNHLGIYQGMLSFSELLTKDPNLTVESVMNKKVKTINCNTHSKEVVSLFERRDLITAAVVDDDNKLIGRITIDDVVDLIREEGEHNLMGQVGLSEEEDIFAPVLLSARRRATWLGLNLLTALAASFVIGLFQLTIEKAVALAVLMPIVASMGGITGSQTLTLVIRGMALGQLNNQNYKQMIINEVLVSLINGVLWAVVLAIITDLWFQNHVLSTVIALAIVINLLIAAVSGLFVPKMINYFGGDPALGGSVVLTTITDIVGFFAFLGLATLFLI